MPYTDPKTGISYPSYEWYQRKVNPETGQLLSAERRAKEIEGRAKEIVAPAKEAPILNIPDTAGVAPDTTEAKGAIKSFEEYYKQKEKEAELARKELERQRAEVQKKEKSLFSKLLSKPTIEEKREEEFKEIGIQAAEFFAEQKADTAEVQKLMEEYDKKVSAKEAALAVIEERPMVESVKEIEKLSEEKKRNIELSKLSSQIKTKLAIMEMKRGNFEQARSFIDQAIEDYTFDLKLEYSRYEDFKEQNADALKDLEDKYLKALDEAQSALKEELETRRNELEQIKELILKYPNAGIKLDDSIEDALEKARGAAAKQPTKKRTQVIEVEGAKKLIDLDTGQVIKDLGRVPEKFTSAEQRAYDVYVNQISAYRTQEEALRDIEEGKIIDAYGNEIPLKEQILSEIGQAGLDKLIEEIHKRLPAENKVVRNWQDITKPFWETLFQSQAPTEYPSPAVEIGKGGLKGLAGRIKGIFTK